VSFIMQCNKGKNFNLGVHIMNTTTNTQYGNSAAQATDVKSFFSAIVDVLFAVKLREQLAANTRGDKADAAYTWGL
jgi:hypothetical protein